MFYSVRDITILEYDEPVREHVVEVRKKPRDDERQRCLHYDLELSHDARLYHYTDYLGNVVDHFDVPQALKELTIEAHSMVELLQLPYVLLESEWDEVDSMLEAFGGHEMLLTSPAIPDTPELREFEASLRLGSSEGPLEYVLRLSKAIYERFEVGDNGDLSAALKNGRTCSRTFAHTLIGLSRRAGLPGRVCRGYLFPDPELFRVPAASPHFWPEVCLPRLGWVGFDPANGVMAEEKHICVSLGRDAEDVEHFRCVHQGQAKCVTRWAIDVHRAEERGPTSIEGLLQTAE
ncbi:MAG: transglutaminase N-terminal domain-containing protein [Vulcanimicrobiota bacterium]